MWIDGGIHAREWISPATVTWMLKELVENDAAHPDLTEKMDWYILPIVNPDGYAYSRIEDRNRMWRKTRSPNGIHGCEGTDGLQARAHPQEAGAGRGEYHGQVQVLSPSLKFKIQSPNSRGKGLGLTI